MPHTTYTRDELQGMLAHAAIEVLRLTTVNAALTARNQLLESKFELLAEKFVEENIKNPLDI